MVAEKGALSSHLPVPPIAANCDPALMSTIDADGLESDIAGDHDWNEDSKGVAKKLPPIDITVARWLAIPFQSKPRIEGLHYCDKLLVSP